MARLVLLVVATLFSSAASFHCTAAAPSSAIVSTPGRPAACVSSSSSACVVASAGRAQLSDIVMAVPKKRQSKMKTRQRKANWFAKTRRQATLALSRAKSVGYDPLEDPKYSFDDVDEDDDDEDEEDEE